MFLFYDLIFIIFAILYLPYMIIKDKWHAGFWMRCGFLSSELKQKLAAKKNIWIHAVSVGEVMAVKGFVDELAKSFPQKQIMVSTVTRTGHALALKQFPDACVMYAPLDLSLAVLSYIKAVRPCAYITAETEIWPNMFYWLNRHNVPIVQVNGRISDKSYPRYKRFSFFLKHVLSYVRCFCMQSKQDAQRIVDIGADPGRVFVTGNMKFDHFSQGAIRAYGQIFLRDYGPVLVAGSTHPGEEKIILNVFDRLRSQFGGLSLILAPRHIERVAEVEALLVRKRLVYHKFSSIMKMQGKADHIVLVDTIGHLRDLYAYGTVVFIGKSLTGKGGQNIIEPASFGKPVIVGPKTENFRSTIELFKQGHAVLIVQDEEELFRAIQDLFDHPNRAAELGENAKNIIQSQQGAVIRTFDRVRPFFS